MPARFRALPMARSSARMDFTLLAMVGDCSAEVLRLRPGSRGVDTLQMPDTPRAGADELGAAIDTLYQGPLDGFTAARNELAAARRKAGDREGADRVKALAKPTGTAWAVNQVWWRDRSVMERLLAAGEGQRAAHRASPREAPRTFAPPPSSGSRPSMPRWSAPSTHLGARVR
jgi:hypothetical protein